MGVPGELQAPPNSLPGLQSPVPAPARRRPSVRLAALLTVAIVGVIGVIYGAGNGARRTASDDSAAPSPPPARAVTPAAPAAPPALVARPAGSLPAPVQAPAAAPVAGDRFLLIGGLDSSFASASGVVLAGGAGAAREVGRLPIAVHDAAAARAPSGAYFFGGGEPSKDAILEVTAGGRVREAGTLPEPASDVAAAAVGGSYYVVGGYTGTQPLDTIVEWHPGGKARVVGHMPVALRYAAVAAAGGKVLIAGGSVDTTASRSVYVFDPAAATVRRIARLPRPLTHASAATLGDTVYVIGGRGAAQGTQTRRILAIDPGSGRVRKAGRLPRGLSDAGVAAVPGAILLAGGRDAAGRPRSEVLRLEPRR
ncbi:MAG: hypothetical protein QOH76_2775 [Thermoleophilaceae bacterium]|nr:hypothetical protein [Thermoleophilaceae bacterium]